MKKEQIKGAAGKGSELGILPIGIEGLTKILYPSGLSGFERPTLTRPKSVLITGAPGAGKTTLAVQMLFNMVKEKVRCSFMTTRDNIEIIKSVALNFGFCSNDDLDNGNPLFIHKSQRKLYEGRSPIIIEREMWLRDSHGVLFQPEVLFIDSLNITYFKKERRNCIKEMFDYINGDDKREHWMLVIVLLEDYRETAMAETMELIKDCEFLADIVIDLTNEDGRRYIEVKKKHYGTHFGGKQSFEICHKHHHLSNIETQSPSGIIVYPSVRKFLKESQTDPYSGKGATANGYAEDTRKRQSKAWTKYSLPKVHTGITHLDSMLSYSPVRQDVKLGESVEKNACIVISGRRGNHKLSFGLNILLAGLWEPVIKDGKIERARSCEKDVLLISLDEPTNFPIDEFALSYDTQKELTKGSIYKGKKLDNGAWIKWRIAEHELYEEKHPRREEGAGGFGCIFQNVISHTQTGRNDHKSVFLNKWCAYTAKKEFPNIEKVQFRSWLPGGYDNYIGGCSTLVVASYRPGYITPDEFLYSILKLTEFEETDEQYYEQLSIPKDIFAVRIPSIKENADEIFEALKGEEIIIKRVGSRDEYVLNLNKYKPELVWSLFETKSLERFKREREVTISVLNDYKRKKTRFSRILFHSTALLQTRFRHLSEEPLFLTALVDYLKSRNIMSIFINNTDEGYNKRISHSVLSVADYVIELNDVAYQKEKGENQQEFSWSKLTLASAKARSFVQTPHYVSVQQKRSRKGLVRNELIMSNKIKADKKKQRRKRTSLKGKMV